MSYQNDTLRQFASTFLGHTLFSHAQESTYGLSHTSAKIVVTTVKYMDAHHVYGVIA